MFAYGNNKAGYYPPENGIYVRFIFGDLSVYRRFQIREYNRSQIDMFFKLFSFCTKTCNKK